MSDLTGQVLDRLGAAARAVEQGRLYAILDGARDERIMPEVVGSAQRSVCLFDGELPAELAAAAPWLVDLDEGATELTEWLVEEGWGQSWGVFVVAAKLKLGAVRKHLRRFLQVNRAGKKLFFRYYDPRVLRVYLPTCNPEELEVVIGPLSSYLLEDRDPQRLLTFTRDGEGALVQEAAELRRPAAPLGALRPAPAPEASS